MSFANKRVLVTGGCGFIGSNLSRQLLKLGAQVTIVDSLNHLYGGNMQNISDIQKDVELLIADLSTMDDMKKLVKGKDYIFNLAAQISHVDSMTNPFNDFAINAKAQLVLLETIRKVAPQVRIVFASTRQVYGIPQYLPVDELHPVIPVDNNGIHKITAENYHLLYSRVYGIAASCLRLTNTYGPGMRIKDARQTFLGIWIKQALMGETINIFGDGEQCRDFNYVGDVSSAFIAAALNDNSIGKIFNLGSNEVINLSKLAQMLIEINGSGRFQLVPFPSERKIIDIGNYYGNWEKAKRELGWTPVTDLRSGLTISFEYYKQYLNNYIK